MTQHRHTSSPEALRAVQYANGQIWDASRGWLTAYAAHTGDTGPLAIPAWDDLTDVQRATFIMVASEPVLKIARIVDVVAEVSS